MLQHSPHEKVSAVASLIILLMGYLDMKVPCLYGSQISEGNFLTSIWLGLELSPAKRLTHLPKPTSPLRPLGNLKNRNNRHGQSTNDEPVYPWQGVGAECLMKKG